MKNKGKIPKTFFIFLIASSFIWLLITFSKDYSSTLTYNLIYENIPQDKLLQETPVKELKLMVKSSGFKILSSNIKNRKIKIDASKLKKGKNSIFYLLTKNQLKSINSQLQYGVEVVDIEKDTIYLNLGDLVSKKVPIKAKFDIQYHIGYDLIDSIRVTPDSILISGPNKIIDSLKYIETQPIELKDIKANFSEKTTVLPIKKSGVIKMKTSSVTISGKVDKFTEGSLELPFTIKNLPDNIAITTLKETVEIKFIVALSNFNKIDEALLKIECNYNNVIKNNLSYLIPKLVSKPDFIKSYKIIPNKIDFLIRKK